MNKKTELDLILERGVAAHRNEQFQEAEQHYKAILAKIPSHPDANHNLGILAKNFSKKDLAISLFKKAIEAKPEIEQFWLSLIETLFEMNRHTDAEKVLEQCINIGFSSSKVFQLKQKIDSLPHKQQLKELMRLYNDGALAKLHSQAKKILEQYPDKSLIHNIIGAAHAKDGNVIDAIASYQQALELDPTLALAHNNLGLLMQDQGNTIEAKRCFENAIACKSGFAEPMHNLALIYFHENKLTLAEKHCQNAIDTQPSFSIAYISLGAIKLNQGHPIIAIKHYLKAIDLQPHNRNAYKALGNLLQKFQLTERISGLSEQMEALLTENRFRPRSIARCVVSYLKLDPTINSVLETSVETLPQIEFIDTITQITENSLLIRFMSLCPVPDIKFETLFKKIRRRILEEIYLLQPDAQLLKFQSALALQCFQNEYVYGKTEHEEKAIRALEYKIASIIETGKQPGESLLLCLASYKPLSDCVWVDKINQVSFTQSMIFNQIKHSKEEKVIQKQIVSLGNIKDKVSQTVREQYEQHPYPRWTSLGLPSKSYTLRNMIYSRSLQVKDEQALATIKKPSILIAGCGTGQHAIESATTWRDCQVVAIDISKSSLAYAKRKADEIGVKNISFLHVDILDLPMLGQDFDIIECVGVLHHMHDPMQGWQRLRERLRSDGLMRIGLYSKIARREISAFRSSLDKLNLSTREVLALRNRIIEEKRTENSFILNSNDFYSTSDVKDLLFHVQEHNFTIDMIRSSLSELGMTFCGFEDPNFMTKFQAKYTDKKDLYDFTKWEEFELENPDTFSGMYQFWCQKTS